MAAAFLLFSCSPAELFSKPKDQGVLSNSSGRFVNTACAQLNLGSELSAPSCRKLVQCLNEYGALNQLESLVNRMSDDELQPTVDLLNTYFLRQKKRMYELETLYSELDHGNQLKEALKELGKALEQSALISSVLKALGEAYAADPDQAILGVLHELSPKLTLENMQKTMDIGLQYARSRVFSALQSHFSDADPSGDPDTQALIQGVLDYASIDEAQDPSHHFSLEHDLIAEAINGELFEAIDQYLGTDAKDLTKSIPQAAGFIHLLLENNSALANSMSSLFRSEREPLTCFDGSQQVEDPAMYLLSQAYGQMFQPDPVQALRALLVRDHPLKIAVSSSLCSFPPSISNYRALQVLGTSDAVGTIGSLIQAVYGVTRGAGRGQRDEEAIHPVAKMLVKFSGDTGPRDQTGIKRLIPLANRLDQRGATEDLLLILNLLDDSDRRALQDALAFLVAANPAFQSQSILGVVETDLSRVSAATLYSVARNIQKSINASGKLVDPLLSSVRAVFYRNDTHPFVEFLSEFLANAKGERKFYDSLFKVVSYSEFEPALALVAQMAQDGRLKDILGATLTIFNKASQEGAHPIAFVTEPVFALHNRHDLIGEDLPPGQLRDGTASSDVGNSFYGCMNLDFNLKLTDEGSAQFGKQLDSLLSCMNFDHAHGDAVAAVDFLRDNKTSGGESYFDWTIDLLKGMRLNEAQQAVLSDKLLNAIVSPGSGAEPKLFRLMEGARLLTAAEVVRPLFDLIRPVETQVPQLRRLGDYAAQVFNYDYIAPLLPYGWNLWKKKPEPDSSPVPGRFDIPRIKRWVSNKECETLSGANVEQKKSSRALEIIEDFEQERDTFDLDPATDRPSQEWNRADFKAALEPVLSRLGDPSRSEPGRPLMQGLLSFMRRQDPQAILTWFENRAHGSRLISYYYPKQTYPRVRLVSSLDRLELVLLNADMTDLQGANQALDFISKIGEAWGDEKFENWPREIQERFPIGGPPPPRLQQAVDEMEAALGKFTKMAGLLKLPGCKQVADPNDPVEVQADETSDPRASGFFHPGNWKIFGTSIPDVRRRLFNLHEVLSVLREDLPGTPGLQDSGIKLLRDLFWEIEMSTPSRYRGPKSGNGNNFNAVLQLAQLGLLHQIGHQLGKFQPGDPAPLGIFQAFVQASASENTNELSDILLGQDPGHALFWALTDQVFNVEEASSFTNPLMLEPKYQNELRGLNPDQAGAAQQEWQREFARMKQMGIYAFGQAAQLKIIDPLIGTLNAVIRHNSDYLIQHADLVGGLLRSARVSYFLRALGEDTDELEKERLGKLLNDVLGDRQRGLDLFDIARAIDQDAAAKRSWDLFTSRWDALGQRPQYQALRLSDIGDDIVGFWGETEPDRARTAARLRAWASEQMLSKSGGARPSNLEEILLLMRDKPDEMDHLLQAIGHYTGNGELKNFLTTVYTGLRIPIH